MDVRLKIARMTECGFFFMEAVHLYTLCLLEVSRLGASFGCLVRMKVERFGSSFISFLPFGILCSMSSSIHPTDLVTLATFLSSFFQSG